MTAITELGYMRLGVSSLSAWKQYATQILGLELVDEGEPGRCYLRMDSWHHRFILEEDGSDDLNALGLRVAGPEEFRAMDRRLSEANVGHEIGSRALADDRRVLEIMLLDDPNGNPIEIFHGPLVQYGRPFHPGRPMFGGFATGTAGLGHCLIRNYGLEATYEFYRLLGMRGSIQYKSPRPDGSVAEFLFFHCNDRQHTIGFGAGTEKRINHVLIEARTFDDLAHTRALMQERGIPVAIELGKHSNDHLYSFYCANPSGWMVEYGWGSRPSFAQSEYYEEDVYGHQHQPDVLDEKWNIRVTMRKAAE